MSKSPGLPTKSTSLFGLPIELTRPSGPDNQFAPSSAPGSPSVTTGTSGAAGESAGDSLLPMGTEPARPADPVPDSPVLRKNWLPDSAVTACPLCQRTFSFLLRRHHCRWCGGIFCGDCSWPRLRMIKSGGRGIDGGESPVRICTRCYATLRDRGRIAEDGTVRIEAHRPMDGHGVCPDVATLDNDNLDDELRMCPVCSMDLPEDAARETHLLGCLARSPGPNTIIGTRYTVHRAPPAGTTSRECAVCLEDIVEGQPVALLNCLCQFHEHCIADWFRRDRGCPYHPIYAVDVG